MSPDTPPVPEPGALQPLLPADPSSLAGYRLLGRLGSGGMGVVYLGRTDAGALAAVKVTHGEYADEPEFRARFRREVEAARRVTSPWAVPVTGADPDAPAPWMATAFVPGLSVGEAVAAHGPLPERSVRILGGAVARALAAVHAAGLVHRDVKPGNVMLAVDGPRLIDFGIARTTGDTTLTSTDMVVGTPGFLAPEQAEARTGELGPPADVFALGCLLVHAATGRPPFGAGSVEALLYRTVHDEPDLDGVPEGLLGLVRSCLAKDPAARPTAAEATVLLTEDAPGEAGDWLPAPVVRTIAERAARMLALPAIDLTQADRPDTPTPATGRRGFLLAAGGAALVAAGGLGTWAALRDGDDGPGTTPAASSAHWSVGVLADLSGPAREIGRAQERGARLAVEEFNARIAAAKNGDPLGKLPPAGLKVSDERGDPAGAPAAARALTADPAVLAVLGPTSDATGQAVLPVFEEAGLALVTVSAGYNLLTLRDTSAPPNVTILRAIPHHIFAGMHLSYAALLLDGVRRPGVLQERTDDHYSWQYVRGVDYGLRVAGVERRYRVIPGRVTDYRPILAGMIDAGIDSYIHCGVAETAVLAARALTALGFTGPRFGGQHVFGTTFLKEAGRSAEGWFVTAPVGDPVSPAPDTSADTRTKSAAFAAAYRKRYGTAPPPYAGESYDIVAMTLRQLAAAAAAGRAPARKGLWQSLRTQRYDGAMGAYAFNESGDLTQGGTFLYAVTGGAYKLVGAAPATPTRTKQG